MRSTIVWLYRPEYEHWCVLRHADPGGLITTRTCGSITTLCMSSDPYSAALIATAVPADKQCPACATELAAGTPGAAVAVTPDPSRVPTVDLRAPAAEQEDDWGPDSRELRNVLVEHEDLMDLPVRSVQ